MSGGRKPRQVGIDVFFRDAVAIDRCRVAEDEICFAPRLVIKTEWGPVRLAQITGCEFVRHFGCFANLTCLPDSTSRKMASVSSRW